MGEKIYAPKHYLKTILEGLAEICKTVKWRSCRVELQLKNWKWMEMAKDAASDTKTSSNGSSKWNYDPNTKYLTLRQSLQSLTTNTNWK